MTWSPACMTADEYALWQEADASSGYPVLRPCHDCPVAWRLAREAEGCCNRAEPIVRTGGRPIVPVDDLELELRRYAERRKRRRWRARRRLHGLGYGPSVVVGQ